MINNVLREHIQHHKEPLEEILYRLVVKIFTNSHARSGKGSRGMGHYTQFVPAPSILSHLSVFKLPSADLRSFVVEQDIIYVGGGNTKNLLALWKEWGLDGIFR